MVKRLRELHLYLGSFFAPLVIYFALSGAWQVFRWNDLPKKESPSLIQKVFHELSKPHTHSTSPGLDPKEDPSTAFKGVVLLMALGLTATTTIGLLLALRYTRTPRIGVICVGLGVVLPIGLLLLR